MAQKEGNLVAMKGRFRGESTGLNGLFFTIVDPAARRLDRFTAVVANEGNLLRTDIRQGWRQFEETLYTARFSGGIAQNLSREVQTYMLTHLAGRQADDFYEAAESGRTALAQEVLSTLLGRVLGDGNVVVEISPEEVARAELAPPAKEEAPAPAAPAGAEGAGAAPAAEGGEAVAPQESQPRITIKVEPMLSPLRGIAVTKLQPGQRIVVRPVETSEIGRHLVRLTAQGLGVPENQIPVTVLGVEPAEFDRVRIRTAFGPGIVGISSISPELKIALAPPLAGAAASPTASPEIAAVGGSWWGFVLALVVVIFLLYVAFYVVGPGAGGF